MKKTTIFIILLMLFGFSTVFAQATRTATPVDDPQTKSLLDPKLSPEEQALRLTAGEDNPAKINETTVIDPKINPEDLPSEEDYGPSNAKPAEGQDADPKLEAELAKKAQPAEPDPSTQPVSRQDQPAGEKSGTVINYRNMQAGENDQPKGDQPANITNYRELQGPNEQPAGDKPNK